MAEGHSVSGWIKDLKQKQDDSAAIRAIFNRYFLELQRYARKKLHGAPRCAQDEEDVALNALNSFIGAAQEGRFPDLADRNDLWRLLLRMTARKAHDLRRHENRQKRGGKGTREHVADDGGSSRPPADLVDLTPADVATPEFIANWCEEYERLLGLLPDPQLRELVQKKLDLYSNQEIAEQFGCSLRTIERRLRLIRRIWSAEMDS